MPSKCVLIEALAAAFASGGDRRPIVVRGGDLHRSLGSPAAVTATMRLPIDTIAVIADDRPLTAVAHVVVRRPGRSGWWRDRIVAVMNVDHLGELGRRPARPSQRRLARRRRSQRIDVATGSLASMATTADGQSRTASRHHDSTRACRVVHVRGAAERVGRRHRARHGRLAPRRSRADAADILCEVRTRRRTPQRRLRTTSVLV